MHDAFSSMSPTHGYRIREGIYFAAVQGEGVLLDLAANRYVGLGPESARIWAAVAAGGLHGELVRSLDGIDAGASPEQVVDQQLKIWLEQGLLVSAAQSATQALPACRRRDDPSARVELDRAMVDAAPWTPRALGRLLEAALWWKLRGRRALPEALRHLQRIAVRPDPDWTPTAARILRVYHAARRPFRQGTSDCLSRSMILAHALRRERVDAVVCFGLQKMPFDAHAWVEVGRTVCNDTLQALEFRTEVARF
jgi:Transglutaminase-like superfamily